MDKFSCDGCETIVCYTKTRYMCEGHLQIRASTAVKHMSITLMLKLTLILCGSIPGSIQIISDGTDHSYVQIESGLNGFKTNFTGKAGLFLLFSFFSTRKHTILHLVQVGHSRVGLKNFPMTNVLVIWLKASMSKQRAYELVKPWVMLN
ncbi:hypothetical protein YC2023_082535 [Brassica napus]